MKLLTSIFAFLVLNVAEASLSSPYEAEGKARDEITNLLSALIIPEQFIVQVNSEVAVEKQKKVTELETVEDEAEHESTEPPELLPGFQLEFQEPEIKRKPAKKTLERYALEDVPKLKVLRVSISFDDVLPEPAVKNAQNLVKNYVSQNYPGVGRVSFTKIPMLKKEPVKPEEPKQDEKVEPPKPEIPPEKPPTFEENLLKWLPWGALALTLILLFINTRAKQPQPNNGPVIVPMYPQPPQASNDGSQAGGTQGAPLDDEGRLRLLKNRVFGKAIANAPAFAQYYEKLTSEEKQEIEAGLGGPAFDSFMDGLGVERGKSEDPVSDVEERLTFHENQFQDFVQANTWRQKQFFGFLAQLNNEQLMSLTGFENETNVSLMLRFLKPDQSAYLLDHISEAKRAAILARMTDASKMPLSDITVIEKRIRDVVQRLPRKMGGAEEQQAEFWGSVLDHSEHSSELLQNIEKTNPAISIKLQKYKFSLDDAATLPDEYLSKVVSETDNEELGLALAACPERTVDLILESLPEKRRNLVKQMLPSYKTSPKDRIKTRLEQA